MRKYIAVALICAAVIPSVVGCKSEAPVQSTTDVASFKGAPMPAAARARIAEANRKAMEKRAAAQANHP